jgi:hypothetical protein
MRNKFSVLCPVALAVREMRTVKTEKANLRAIENIVIG